VDKLCRWASKLQRFCYVIGHLPGEENLWADMLVKWIPKCSKVFNIWNAPGLQYSKYTNVRNSPLTVAWGWLDVMESWCLWTRCGSPMQTISALEFVSWDTLASPLIYLSKEPQGESPIEEYVNSFWGSCHHCRVNYKSFIPRRLGEVIDGAARNQGLHYDFLYIQKKLEFSNQPLELVVVLKDETEWLQNKKVSQVWEKVLCLQSGKDPCESASPLRSLCSEKEKETKDQRNPFWKKSKLQNTSVAEQKFGTPSLRGIPTKTPKPLVNEDKCLLLTLLQSHP